MSAHVLALRSLTNPTRALAATINSNVATSKTATSTPIAVLTTLVEISTISENVIRKTLTNREGIRGIRIITTRGQDIEEDGHGLKLR
jgi:hypothetical protein